MSEVGAEVEGRAAFHRQSGEEPVAGDGHVYASDLVKTGPFVDVLLLGGYTRVAVLCLVSFVRVVSMKT